MGCSNPHPHGQIWSQCSVPDEPKRELERMTAYLEENGQPLLIDYLTLELEQKDRIVCENDGFVALVPFWATWPFEILVLPRRQMESLDAMTDAEKVLHAEILKCVGASGSPAMASQIFWIGSVHDINSVFREVGSPLTSSLTCNRL